MTGQIVFLQHLKKFKPKPYTHLVKQHKSLSISFANDKTVGKQLSTNSLNSIMSLIISFVNDRTIGIFTASKIN